MAIKIERGERMARAVARAKAERMLVKLSDKFGTYAVVNRTAGTEYTVRFWKASNGIKLGQCSCAAGEKDQMCKHIAAGVLIHIAIAAAKR